MASSVIPTVTRSEFSCMTMVFGCFCKHGCQIKRVHTVHNSVHHNTGEELDLSEKTRIKLSIKEIVVRCSRIRTCCRNRALKWIALAVAMFNEAGRRVRSITELSLVSVNSSSLQIMSKQIFLRSSFWTFLNSSIVYVSFLAWLKPQWFSDISIKTIHRWICKRTDAEFGPAAKLSYRSLKEQDKSHKKPRFEILSTDEWVEYRLHTNEISIDLWIISQCLCLKTLALSDSV